MRPDRELTELIAAAVETSGGSAPLDINAYSPEEAARLRELMKGKRGLKTVGVRLADPSEAVPSMEGARGW